MESWAYKKGKIFYRIFKDRATNPYLEGTVKYNEWRKGFLYEKGRHTTYENGGSWAYKKGKIFYRIFKDRATNPYLEGTVKYKDWLRGFFDEESKSKHKTYENWGSE